MRLTDREILIFLVGLEISAKARPASSISKRLDEKYGIKVTWKSVHDILYEIAKRKYVNAKEKWGSHARRNIYSVSENESADAE